MRLAGSFVALAHALATQLSAQLEIEGGRRIATRPNGYLVDQISDVDRLAS